MQGRTNHHCSELNVNIIIVPFWLWRNAYAETCSKCNSSVNWKCYLSAQKLVCQTGCDHGARHIKFQKKIKHLQMSVKAFQKSDFINIFLEVLTCRLTDEQKYMAKLTGLFVELLFVNVAGSQSFHLWGGVSIILTSNVLLITLLLVFCYAVMLRLHNSCQNGGHLSISGRTHPSRINNTIQPTAKIYKDPQKFVVRSN